MKKISKYFLILFSLLCGFCVSAKTVDARTLTMEDTGWYFDRHESDGTNPHSWHWQKYTLDGEIAYCIKPSTPEGITYYQGDWSYTDLPESIRDRMSLIAYYGYTYPGHQTIEYLAATQGMLWETQLGNGTIVNYASKRWNTGTKLDISDEKAEIERLIANHYVKPSFNGQTITAQVGQTFSLTDSNGVLGNYGVEISGANYSISGNTITITPTSNNVSIVLSKKMVYSSRYKLWFSNDKQDMLTAGNVDPVYASINVNTYYGAIEINKYDSETYTSQGQATLSGAVYGVYSLDGTLITTITTNESGYGKSASVLSYGNYYLKEISASTGYYLDNTRYDFEIKGVSLVSRSVKEDIIKNYISILKQYDYVDGNTTFLNAESGIKFEIYYPNGTLYNTITTDKNGYATINIPYGVWKFHQVNSNTGFEKINDFYITIDENSEKEQYYNILNNSISAYLQVVKVDADTGNTIAIANTTFKIYNKDTNQYVSQYVGGKVYSEFKTDEDGKFITYLKLPAGNYKLIEISSPKGYVLDKNGLEFTIGEETYYNYTTYGAFVTVKFENSQIKGQIEIYKDGEVFNIDNDSYNYDERTSLEGVVFNIYAKEDIKSSDGNYIYYNQDTLVDTITTNSNGYAISKKLPLGKYYVIEVSTKEEYILDNNVYEVELKEIDNKTPIVYSKLNMSNILKKGKLDFTKTDLVNGDVIPNTIIEIYTDNGELIFTGKTDKNGKVVIDELKIGKYYIKEKEASTGYVITDEIVYFELKDNGEIVKAEMKNKPITGIVEITKQDISTSEPLPNTLIEVYNDKDELIYSGRTNEEGKIIIENLRYGRYYFIEKEAPEGYTINNEKMYFDILEDGEIVKSTIKDEKIIVEVPDTMKYDYSSLKMIGIISLGLCVFIYGYIKNKKSNK